MHQGRLYPYMREYWQAECQFFPGYVPRRWFIKTAGINGDSWDLLIGGIVTDVGLPDAFAVGDPLWSYSSGVLGFTLELLWHKTSLTPLVYTPSLRMARFFHANVISGEVAAPQYTCGGLGFTVSSGPDLPFFNGTIPAITCRPARWSEV